VSRSEVNGADFGRRDALRLLTVGAAAGLLAGCTGGSTPAKGPTTNSGLTASGPATGSAAGSGKPPTPADWRALAAGLHGSLVQPGETGFAVAHRLYDPRWDTVVPAAVVRATRAHDVVEAIRFATRHGLRITPRGGGHSYLGASSSPGGLVVDLRGIDAVGYDAASKTATIGGGAQLIDVYRHLSTHGRGIPGGTCPTVGVAGLAQGGGFGIFDRLHGLTCDVVTEMDVVTAVGRKVQASPTVNPDLFWALRGGGGGDFGIVTGMRLRTFRTGNIGRWAARWPWSRAARVVAGWQTFLTTADRDTWANLHLDVVPSGRSVLVIGFSLSGHPGADRDALVSHVGVDPSATSTSTHSHLDTVMSLAGCESESSCHLPPQGTFARESFVAGSTVAKTWLSAPGIARLVAAVDDHPAWTGERHAVCDPLGGRVAQVDASATAFPWRSAPFTVQWYAALPVSHPPADVSAAGQWVAAARRRLAPDSAGAYINYPSADVTASASYHGAAFARLRLVKAAWDPGAVFRPPAGVPG
jgi:FAD/FMN-containing dehydrogenase